MKQDKEQQKKLIIEIMDADEKNGLYKQQTAVEWLIDIYVRKCIITPTDMDKALSMEKKQTEIAYETGWVNGDLKKAPSRGKDYYVKKFDSSKERFDQNESGYPII